MREAERPDRWRTQTCFDVHFRWRVSLLSASDEQPGDDSGDAEQSPEEKRAAPAKPIIQERSDQQAQAGADLDGATVEALCQRCMFTHTGGDTSSCNKVSSCTDNRDKAAQEYPGDIGNKGKQDAT